MNKQEAIKELRRQSTQVYDQRAVELEQAIHIVSQIDETQKPVVPKSVAEWYSLTVENGHDPLVDFTDVILTMGRYDGRNPIYNYDTGLYKWIKETPNAIQIVVNMHQFGYTVEQEQLYTVEIPNPNSISLRRTFLGKVANTGKIQLRDLKEPNELCKLTEKEIKEDFDWAWKFAKPVPMEVGNETKI